MRYGRLRGAIVAVTYAFEALAVVALIGLAGSVDTGRLELGGLLWQLNVIIGIGICCEAVRWLAVKIARWFEG